MTTERCGGIDMLLALTLDYLESLDISPERVQADLPLLTGIAQVALATALAAPEWAAAVNGSAVASIAQGLGIPLAEALDNERVAMAAFVRAHPYVALDGGE